MMDFDWKSVETSVNFWVQEVHNFNGNYLIETIDAGQNTAVALCEKYRVSVAVHCDMILLFIDRENGNLFFDNYDDLEGRPDYFVGENGEYDA